MTHTQFIIVQRIIGVIFTLAGVVNFFGLGEDLSAILQTASDALKGTRLHTATELIVKFDWWAFRFVGAFMFITGATQLLNLRFAHIAGVAQLFLMTAFIAILHRAYPEVIFDGFLIIVIATLLTHKPTEVPI